jgi:hypothetical protein
MLMARGLEAGDGVGVNGLKRLGFAVAPFAFVAARVDADPLKPLSELVNARIEAGDRTQMLMNPSQDADRDLKLLRQGV